MRLRRAHAADLAALDLMLGRCSVGTRARRFNVPVHRLPRAYAAAIAAGDGEHWVVDTADGALVALGSCSGAGELGILVEDAAQGRGIGTRLLERVVRGRVEAFADVALGNPRALRMLQRLGQTRTELGPEGYRLVMQLGATLAPCSTEATTARTAPSPARSRSSASAGRC